MLFSYCLENTRTIAIIQWNWACRTRHLDVCELDAFTLIAHGDLETWFFCWNLDIKWCSTLPKISYNIRHGRYDAVSTGDLGLSGPAGGGHTVHPRASQRTSDGYPCIANCTELLNLCWLQWSLGTQLTDLHVYRYLIWGVLSTSLTKSLQF